MPRNLSGEQALVATTLHLRKDTWTAGGVSTSLQSVYELFLLIERLKTTGALDESSDDPCSQQLIATFVRGLHDLCRLKSVHVPVSEISGLGPVLQAYRLLTNDMYSSVKLLDTVSNTYFDLLQRLNLIAGSQGGPRLQRYQVFSEEPQTWFAPNISKSFYRRSSHVALNQEENHWYAPQEVRKSFYRRSSHFSIEPENHTWLAVTRAANEYTLENADPNGLSRGAVVLKKDGVVVSTVQVVPNPTNQQNMLMSVDSAGTLHYSNPGSHTSAHGNFGGSGSGSDNFIGSLDFLSSSGHLRAIITPNQVTVTTPQSLDSRYVTLSQHALDIGISNGLHTLRASEVAALQARCTALEARCAALEAAALTFKGGNGATPVAVKQIQVSELPWAYYPTGQILWIEKDTPVASSPFT